MLDKVRRSLRLIELLPNLEIRMIAAQDGSIEHALDARGAREGTRISSGQAVGVEMLSRTMPEH
jgi:hypothetical protein